MDLDLEEMPDEVIAEEIPVDYAALHGITHLKISNDGWVQRSPDSWFAMNWMEYGIRVVEEKRAPTTEAALDAAAEAMGDENEDEGRVSIT